MCDAGTVTLYMIRFEGPAARAVGVATELADAPGVDLRSSAPPSVIDQHSVRLDVSVDGTRDAVEAAVAAISKGLPKGASIEITAG
jgi:hypothetical protein